MLQTLEMRWFKPGEIPVAVRQWFDQTCPGTHLGEAETRTDWYLEPIAPCDYLNIKFRQGRLEIKWRQMQFPQLSLQQQWQGRMEQWGKWLCEEATLQEFVPEGQAWIAVQKSRSQRQFVISADACCNLELTQLRVDNQNWWTLGLESTRDQESLHSIARQLSETCPATLTDQQAMAYPHWLFRRLRQNP
ncbi:MAG: hypothetical protein BRC33_07935 [Cyanobacteria bacterium SW_9_44_58]|nr:MAG: hypothetical protein BRC33_07935 [Cyanobacteria bacterium SW_9_44_58]